MIVLLSIISIFLAFCFRASTFLDPDFGWHIRMGEIISRAGIPTRDPFSYTMPSFPFISHEWLVDVLLKNLYESLGMTGLSLIFTTIAFLALYPALRGGDGRRTFWEVSLVLGFGIIFPYFGVRPQVVTWLFWAIFLTLVLSQKVWDKWRFFLPFFFVVWVNLHASFAIGIVSLALIGIFSFWEKRKRRVDLILVFLLSTLATFINPYGPRIWYEVWLSISDTSLRWSILEWQPAFFSVNLALIFYLVVSVFLIWRSRKRYGIYELSLYFFFLLQGLASTRHIPLWVILSIPMTIRAFGFLLASVKGIAFGEKRFKLVYKWTLYLSVVIALLQSFIILGAANSMDEEGFYPKGAVLFLKQNLPQGEIFSVYGWGGYLIWKLTEKKVFIDGRMPSWRYGENPTSESSYAMRDYTDVLNGRIPYQEIFEKYGVSVVLWPKDKPLKFFDTLSQKLEQVLFKKGEPFNLVKELEKDGWQKVYEDQVAVIYQHPQ